LYPLQVVKLPSLPYIARLRGDCDCPTGFIFTSHTPTIVFLPAGRARSIVGMTRHTTNHPMNLPLLSTSLADSALESKIVAY